MSRIRSQLESPVTVSLLVLLACHPRTPQPPPPPRGDPDLGALLERVRAETQVPGIAAAVVDRDRVLAIAAAGLRRVDEGAPLDPSDRFHLGSNTKAMTAMAVARYVERGRLRWETTLAEAFPEWSASMDPVYRAVPIREVLRHRAGLAALRKDDDWLFDGIGPRQPLPAQRRALARNALHHPPAVPPGTYLYSNAGYVLAGALLERLAGKPWEDVIREELFGPLAMRSCGFGPPARGRARGQPFGHVLRGDRWEPTDADIPAVIGPAGTVHCSLADWAAFVQANMENPPQPLVSASTLAMLHESLPMGSPGERSGYATGWVTWESPSDGLVLAHDGSNDRNYTLLRVSPGRGRAYLVAVNAGGDRAARAAQRAFELLSAR